MAFKDAARGLPTAQVIEAQIEERGLADLAFLDGLTWSRISTLSKPVRKAMSAEHHVLTKDSPRFIYGQGINES
jgi:hypothetical protein